MMALLDDSESEDGLSDIPPLVLFLDHRSQCWSGTIILKQRKARDILQINKLLFFYIQFLFSFSVAL